MRIIAGEFRSRRLATPADASTTRPIPDRVKESLFGLLRGHCEGATVFDGFSGTGAIGLEAVSRGAKECLCVEKDRRIAAILQENIDTLRVRDRCSVLVGDALGPAAIARCPRPLTLAFLDPPYPLVRETTGYKRVMTQLAALVDLLTDDGFAVLRTPWPLLLSDAPPAEEEPVARRGGKPPRGEKGRRAGGRGKSRTTEPAFADPVFEDEDEEDLPEGKITIGPDGEIIEEIDLGEGVAAPELVRADLKLENADGPETHVYHGMAVHLYMRKK